MEGLLDAPLLEPEPGCVNEKLSIDNMLSKYVGDFGLAQLLHFVVVSLAWCLEGLHTLVMIFADREPQWQCRPAGSVYDHSLARESAFNSSGLRSSRTQGLMDACTPASSLCSMDPSAWEWVGGKGVSTVSEWGLICGDEYKVGLAQSAFFVGAFMGAGIFGHFADSRAGRKGALFLACLTTGLTGLLTATATSYWTYVSYRWLTGFTCSGIGLSSFVLATEPVGPTKRGAVGMSAFYFFSLGIMTLPLLALLSTSWRHLYVITSIPAIVYCALVLPTVWESPRWFVVQGRVSEAMDVLHAFAKRNGSHIPDNVGLQVEYQSTETRNPNKNPTGSAPDMEAGSDAGEAMSADLDCKAASGSLLTVLRNPATRSRMLIMVVIWLLTAVVYYGISLNVVSLGTNLYLGVFLNAVIEWPAFAITAVLLERFGRRSMLASAMLLSGLCCFAGSFLFTEAASGGDLTALSEWSPMRTQPYHVLHLHQSLVVGDDGGHGAVGMLKVMRILCSVVGIFGMAATYNLIYIYTSELFPTVVRNAALGLTTQAGGIGSIIAPVVVVSGRYYSALPFGIFGVMAIAGSALSLGLPETLHQPLFETLEGLDEGEKIRRLNSASTFSSSTD